MQVVDKYSHYDDTEQADDAEEVPNIQHVWIAGAGYAAVDLFERRFSYRKRE